MTEWFIVVDCKSISFSTVASSNLASFIKTKYNAVGSVPVLGTGCHVFKSHYFENKNFYILFIKFINNVKIKIKF